MSPWRLMYNAYLCPFQFAWVNSAGSKDEGVQLSQSHVIPHALPRVLGMDLSPRFFTRGDGPGPSVSLSLSLSLSVSLSLSYLPLSPYCRRVQTSGLFRNIGELRCSACKLHNFFGTTYCTVPLAIDGLCSFRQSEVTYVIQLLVLFDWRRGIHIA